MPVNCYKDFDLIKITPPISSFNNLFKFYKKIVIISDIDADGLCASYILSQQPEIKKLGDNVEYVYHRHGDFMRGPINEMDRTLYIYLDLTLDPSRLFQDSSVIIIDHHKSGIDAYRNYIDKQLNTIPARTMDPSNASYYTYVHSLVPKSVTTKDIDGNYLRSLGNVHLMYCSKLSATGICYKLFHDSGITSSKGLFVAVNANDIWEHRSVSDKYRGIAIDEYLKKNPVNSIYENYEFIAYAKAHMNELLARGEEIKLDVDDKIKDLVDKRGIKFGVDADGYRFAGFTSHELPANLALEALYECANVDYAFKYTTLDLFDDKILVSFRSKKNGRVDLSAIAAKFKGGGHKSAAGCRMTVSEFKNFFNNPFKNSYLTNAISNKGVAQYIVVEGCEGSGKSTYINTILEEAKLKRDDIVLVREPGGTKFSDLIRNVLKDGLVERDYLAEMYAILAARSDLLLNVVVPALKEGKLVISDRSFISSIVYQGIRFKNDLEMRNKIFNLIFQNLEIIEGCSGLSRGINPDTVIYLTTPLDQIITNLNNRDGGIVKEGLYKGDVAGITEIYEWYNKVMGELNTIVDNVTLAPNVIKVNPFMQ